MGIKPLRSLLSGALGAVALWSAAAAQGYPPPTNSQGAPPPGYSTPPASNPICVRLEAQLATLSGSGAEAARADQIRRAEDTVSRQQADLDRALTQAHKQGCAGEGFFALFSGLSPQCGPITSQIQQMRSTLDRSMSELEQLKSGTSDQESQRRALVGQLAQNNCGAQYTAAANANGPGGFFDALLGGGTVINPTGDGAPAGTYHTVCVRTCDGYYFPISFSTVPSRFADDARTCQRLCPAAEVTLYSYQNPGQTIDQAMSINGAPYTALPNAYLYRKQVTPACSCRRPGQSWADALKGADDSSTLESGDIVVTDQNAKALSQVPQSAKSTAKPAALPQTVTAAPQPQQTPSSESAEPGKRTIRIVGPPFLSPK